MEGTHLKARARWKGGRPICRRYLLVQFADALTQVRSGAAACSWPVTWAVGAMGDGQAEAVGAWQHSSDGMLDWRSVFDDLASRGVERIRYAAHVDAVSAQSAFPDLTVLSPAWPKPSHLDAAAGQGTQMSTGMRRVRAGRHGALSEPPRRVLQLARRVDQAAQVLHRGLSQAATQHGPFVSALAAAEFVEAWLANAELRQRRRRLAAVRAAGLRAAAVAP